MSIFYYISLWLTLKKNMITKLQKLYTPPRNLRVGNKPLCVDDLPPMPEILTESPDCVSILLKIVFTHQR